ncbi:MAG: outer-membrane lipoprotein carrier protein LolA, partial [Porphyromonadaceae bacterium]|nr:outer-membrane lipoprotein carrier protein LolA [Porphyromonadaceae bacterium]
SQEINVSQPEEEELWQINPYFLLREYKKTFDPHFIGRTGNICELSLTPKQTSEIQEIRLFIDEKANAFSRITILQTEGEYIQITITRYEKREKFPDGYFTCKKEDFPQAEFIDLR